MRMTVKEAIQVSVNLILDAGTVTDEEVKKAERVLAESDWNKRLNLAAWHVVFDAKQQRGITD